MINKAPRDASRMGAVQTVTAYAYA